MVWIILGVVQITLFGFMLTRVDHITNWPMLAIVVGSVIPVSIGVILCLEGYRNESRT